LVGDQPSLDEFEERRDEEVHVEECYNWFLIPFIYWFLLFLSIFVRKSELDSCSPGFIFVFCGSHYRLKDKIKLCIRRKAPEEWIESTIHSKWKQEDCWETRK